MAGLTRRRFLGGAAAALCSGAGAALAACGRPVAAARPVAAQPVTVLRLQPVIEGGLDAVRSAEEQVLAGFTAKHRGLRVTMENPAGSGANIAAILGGRGPDVFWDYHYAPYLEKAALLRLDPYLTRDNIDPDRWSAGQMTTLRTVAGVYALPAFFGTQVYAVNLGDFDARRYAHPSPDWTHDEFVAIAHKLSGTDSSGHRHYGAGLQWYQNQTGDGEVRWLFAAFRGAYIDGAGLALEIAGPAAVAAGEWIYEELIWPRTGRVRHPGGTAAAFAHGQVSMAAVGNWGLHALVGSVAPSLRFDFYPFPIFPAGRTTFGTDDFYAIAATTKHSDAAWALLRWLSAEPDWQRAQIRLQLLSPALNALWPEWVHTVQAATPALKGKAVHYFSDAAVGGYALPPQYFAVADPQAQAVVGGYLGRLYTRQLPVPQAFRQAQDQVNALLTAAAARATKAGRAAAGSVGPFAAPPKQGLGAPATRAPAGSVAVGDGGYALAATGGAVGGSADACLYACQTLQLSTATFSCREAAGGPAQAGLMVRGDLSDAAATLALVVGAGGVSLLVRAQPRQEARVVAQVATPAPLWLRLRRSGLHWGAATSPDGAHWTPLGNPQALAVAGCWVGLFAAGSGRATFEHAHGLVVSGAYRIG